VIAGHLAAERRLAESNAGAARVIEIMLLPCTFL
jgi:hypothetical protein